MVKHDAFATGGGTVSARAPTALALGGLLIIASYVVALQYLLEHAAYDVSGALLVGPILVALTYPLARSVARAEADAGMVRIIFAALVLKLLASIVRYAVAFDVYDGVADAGLYIDYGTRVAEQFRTGDFTVDNGLAFIGVGFVASLTGAVLALVGPTELGGFLVFAWLGFWGLYFFYRAFCVGCADGDRRRYALLVFFLPSLLFWPSSIGKEAWMMLTLGLASYGAAKVLARHAGGFPLLALGLAGTVLVRPHMSALVCAGLVVAYAIKRGADRADPLAPVTRLLGIVVLVAVSAVVFGQVARFLGVEGEGVDGVGNALTETASRTNQGGSSYDAQPVRSPLQLPRAAVSVLFRPFPFEAHNLQSLVASFEGVALLALFVTSWPRLRSGAGRLRESPYVTFAAVYALLFVVAFSTFGNFGILARQRVQLYPLALVFLALPRPGIVHPVRYARNHGQRAR
ncbi:MAG: hypothetical protein ACR2KP_17060 [Egibacteraceae bacterium]